MDVARKINTKLQRILNRLKVLNIIKAFKLEITFCQIEDSLKTNLIEIDSLLKKCLRKIIMKPRKAEIRNIITELVRKKNLNDIPFNSENESKIHSNFLNENSDLCEKHPLSSQGKTIKLDFRCDVCKEEFESINNLNIHKRKHMKVNSYLCESCGETFDNVLEWKCHNQKHREKIFDNKQYTKFFPKQKNDFTDHDKKTIGDCLQLLSQQQLKENLFTCCGISFHNKSLLEQHMSEKHINISLKNKNMKNSVAANKVAKFTCECGKIFRLLKSLKKHETLKHSVKNIEHHCTICKKSFSEKGKLNRHILSHRGSQYRCSLCYRQFARSDSLKRHLCIVHYPEKNYACDFCQKKFKLKYNKEVHEENAHKFLNNWIQCEQCGQKFKNKITFKSHLKTHLGKKITCRICGKSFTRKSHYKNHMNNKHSGISPYRSLLDSVLQEPAIES